MCLWSFLDFQTVPSPFICFLMQFICWNGGTIYPAEFPTSWPHSVTWHGPLSPVVPVNLYDVEAQFDLGLVCFGARILHNWCCCITSGVLKYLVVPLLVLIIVTNRLSGANPNHPLSWFKQPSTNSGGVRYFRRDLFTGVASLGSRQACLVVWEVAWPGVQEAIIYLGWPLRI